MTDISAIEWFDYANLSAMIAWILLIVTHRIPRCVSALQILFPCMMAVLYGLSIVADWGNFSLDSFGSLTGVRAVFLSDEALLAGWVHYLAFDFFVGCWMVQKALPIKYYWVFLIPSLILTFLFGPLGLLLFWVLYGIFNRTSHTSSHASSQSE